MNQADISPSSKMRIILAVTAAAMLVLWGLSLIPPITTWGDPNEDGFTYVPVSYATLYLPAGRTLPAHRHHRRPRPPRGARPLRCLSAAG
jgi:hypothetical protein